MWFESSPLIPLMWMHMFFMRFPIDVVFLARDGRVLKIDHKLRPWQVSSIVRGARYALELAAGRAERSNLRVGDRIVIEEPARNATGAS